MLIYEGGHNEDPEFHMDDIYMKTLETIVIPIMVGKDLAAIVQYQGKRNQRGRKKGFSTEDETLILCVTNMAAIAFERLLNKQKDHLEGQTETLQFYMILILNRKIDNVE